MNTSIQGVPLWLLLLLAVVLLTQGTLIFTDARRRQINPWFWGIWGLFQVPMPTIFYILFVKWKQAREAKEEHTNDDPRID
ncbi:MAG: sigmaY antisigma factor component [Paenibacillus sp.]|nr:sigmaY antisigma factor component [Paenibacillus sp.]